MLVPRDDEVSRLISGFGLYLPEECVWVPERWAKVVFPEEIEYRIKPEVALVL